MSWRTMSSLITGPFPLNPDKDFVLNKDELIKQHLDLWPEDQSTWRAWRYVVIHHSLTKDGLVVDWEAIRRWHTGANTASPYKWNDIGYNYGVELDEESRIKVFKGRSLSVTGAHAGVRGISNHFNVYGLGVCAVGNFDLKAPDWKKLLVLSFLVKRLCFVFDIPVENIIGHRDVYKRLGMKVQKSCPGKHFNVGIVRRVVSKIPDMYLI